MGRDEVARTMCSYIEETDDGLSVDLLSEHQFEEVSIARWTVCELLEALMDHPFEDPEDVVEGFALKMLCYRARAEGSEPERLFAIAAETALKWLELIRDEK